MIAIVIALCVLVGLLIVGMIYIYEVRLPRHDDRIAGLESVVQSQGQQISFLQRQVAGAIASTNNLAERFDTYRGSWVDLRNQL